MEESTLTKKFPKEQRSTVNTMLKNAIDIFCSGIPSYMKSRLSYYQINAVSKEINKAVVSKYKSLHQPTKSMSSVARNLYHRFTDKERIPKVIIL